MNVNDSIYEKTKHKSIFDKKLGEFCQEIYNVDKINKLVLQDCLKSSDNKYEKDIIFNLSTPADKSKWKLTLDPNEGNQIKPYCIRNKNKDVKYETIIDGSGKITGHTLSVNKTITPALVSKYKSKIENVVSHDGKCKIIPFDNKTFDIIETKVTLQNKKNPASNIDELQICTDKKDKINIAQNPTYDEIKKQCVIEKNITAPQFNWCYTDNEYLKWIECDNNDGTDSSDGTSVTKFNSKYNINDPDNKHKYIWKDDNSKSLLDKSIESIDKNPEYPFNVHLKCVADANINDEKDEEEKKSIYQSISGETTDLKESGCDDKDYHRCCKKKIKDDNTKKYRLYKVLSEKKKKK